MNVELINLKNQMLERIDQDDLLEVKKVERYIKLLELDSEYNERLKKEGVVVETVNGQQKFLKSHPLLNEKMKLNNQIIALEKTIKFEDGALPTTAPASSSVEGKPGEDDYNVGDLV